MKIFIIMVIVLIISFLLSMVLGKFISVGNPNTENDELDKLNN